MKKKITAIILTLGMLLLAGCVKADIGVKVNKDGTVDASVLMGIEKTMYAMMEGTTDDPLPEMQTDLESEDFTIEEYDDEEYKGFKALRTFDNVEDFSLDSTMGTDAPLSLEETKGFFTTKYVFEGSFEGEEGGVSADEQAIMDQFDLTFTLELPGSIGENNAKSTEGNVLTWDLSMVETTDIKAESSVINVVNIIIVAVAVLVVIAIVVVVLSKRKKNDNKDDNTIQE